MPTWEHEDELLSRSTGEAPKLVCGIDEVGRGCLAGPVVAYAVAFKSRNLDFLEQINDSKKVKPATRSLVAQKIRQHAYVGCGSSSAQEIDHINIYHAALLAMERAYWDLCTHCVPWGVLVDGNKAPPLGLNSELKVRTLIKGDSLSYSIAAASILAKVERDHLITQLDEEMAGRYGWAANKSYGTKTHLRALELYGPCQHHRRSFAPVKKALQSFHNRSKD